MESWQPRRGMIYTFGEGDATADLLCKIPESQREIVHSKHCKPLGIDEIGDLNRLEAWHFMVAGPEGALVTEYGTFHDMDGLRFSNPKATLKSFPVPGTTVTSSRPPPQASSVKLSTSPFGRRWVTCSPKRPATSAVAGAPDANSTAMASSAIILIAGSSVSHERARGGRWTCPAGDTGGYPVRGERYKTRRSGKIPLHSLPWPGADPSSS